MNTALKETWGSSPEVLTFYPTGQVTYCPGGHRKVSVRLPTDEAPSESPEMGLYRLLPAEAKQEFLNSPLGSSDATNSDKTPQARQGLRGLTPHAKRQVKFGTMWMEREYGIEHLSFATFTLPTELVLTASDMEQVLREKLCLEDIGKVTPSKWSLILNRLNKKLVYELKNASLPEEYIGVTELQEQRWIERGQVGYHFHVCFRGRNRNKTWAISTSKLTEIWKQAVLSVMNGNESISFAASTNVQRIKKSVTAYLGKYLSKGRSLKSLMTTEQYLVLCPFAWYSCANTLRKIYKALITRYCGREALMMFRALISVASRELSFHKWITVFSPDGIPMPIAWVGELKSLDWSKPYAMRC